MAITISDEEYEKIAIQAIREYKNKDYSDDQIKSLYSLAIKIVVNNIKKALVIDQNITQITQGSRSITYKDNYSIIDDTVKMMLGLPYVKMW